MIAGHSFNFSENYYPSILQDLNNTRMASDWLFFTNLSLSICSGGYCTSANVGSRVTVTQFCTSYTHYLIVRTVRRSPFAIRVLTVL